MRRYKKNIDKPMDLTEITIEDMYEMLMPLVIQYPDLECTINMHEGTLLFSMSKCLSK